MNIIHSAFVLILVIVGTDACANHSPPQIPNSFLGTVEQGCTPGAISAVTALLTDPSKCHLPLASGGCNLCKLRLYLPETTSSRFLVQPQFNDLGLDHNSHVEGTQCKCSEGCFFHQSSITRFGNFPLPNGLTATGTFSEPFACYSGSSMPSETNPTFTYLIWCETDGGCPNNVVARFSFVTRFELLSPNRPAIKSIFTAKITSLPSTKCLINEMDKATVNFIQGTSGGAPPDILATPSTPAPVRRRKNCRGCNNGSQCQSSVCFRKKCVKSRSSRDKAACGFPTPRPVPHGSCRKEESQNECIRKCLA